MNSIQESLIREFIRQILNEDFSKESQEFHKIINILKDFIAGKDIKINWVDISGGKNEDMDFSTSHKDGEEDSIKGIFDISFECIHNGFEGSIFGNYNVMGKVIESGNEGDFFNPQSAPNVKYSYEIEITGLYLYPKDDKNIPNVELEREFLLGFLNKVPAEIYDALILKIKNLIQEKI